MSPLRGFAWQIHAPLPGAYATRLHDLAPPGPLNQNPTHQFDSTCIILSTPGDFQWYIPLPSDMLQMNLIKTSLTISGAFVQFQLLRIGLLAVAALGIGPLAGAAPVVTLSTTLNIGGSGFDAVDFYYASSLDAEFTNYRLNFETTNGSLIYDPLPFQRQDEGGDAIDTFMNTIGSLLGVGNASHIYKPGVGVGADRLAQIDWSVFDTLGGDTNTMAGFAPAPYHLARILVDPNALWHATFTAFDTFSRGVPTDFQFTNDPDWSFPEPLTTPPPVAAPPILPPPPVNEPVVDDPPALDGPPVIDDPPALDDEPVVDDPPIQVQPFPYPGLTIEPVQWIPGDWVVRYPIIGGAQPILFRGLLETLDEGDVPAEAGFTGGAVLFAAHSNGLTGLLNFGAAQSGVGQAAAPEPSSALLAILASGLLAATARRYPRA
jgi:hypothetical protein